MLLLQLADATIDIFPMGKSWEKVLKVTLINLPFLFPRKDEITLSQCLGLRSISAVLKKHKHTVCFIDALMLGFNNRKPYANGFIVGLDLNEIVSRIPCDSDFIGISVAFSQLAPIAHDLIALIRQTIETAEIIMGGVYPSTQTELALTSQADYIVKGEGEVPMLELTEGKDPSQIKGVYIPGKDYTGPFDSADFFENLDDLPETDYNIPKMSSYFKLSQRMIRGRTASLVTSRGCPFKCEFCSIHPVCGYTWRYRSAQNVIDEIHYLIRHHDITCFEFEDDNLTMGRERIITILKEIIRLNDNGADISWRVPNGIRIDTLDEELITLMAKANCRELVLALEHGNHEMLRIMNKKLNLDKAFEIIKTCVEKRFPRIVLFIIVGYPGETKKRFEESLNFLRKVYSLGGNIQFLANLAQPYPGTGLIERCRKNGYITNINVDNFLVRRDIVTTRQVSIITPTVNAREIKRRKNAVYKVCNTLWKRQLKQIMPALLVSIIRSIRARY